MIAFIAGATGYTGQRLVRQLRNHPDWKPRPHARKPGAFDDAVVCDPRDVSALEAGMRGCDAVVQLIGTIRKNFADGDYEAIDYGTTVALGEAARQAGVPRFLLLSSVGTSDRSSWNRYLAVKRKTERWVEASGLEHTIVRPSMIVGPGRTFAKVAGALVSFLPKYRAIDVEDLARVFVRALEQREAVKNRILEGAAMWELIR
jgi:NADH dehydrogenase